ncbi:unnamed protein product, partial [Callosobruchus maculatus]
DATITTTESSLNEAFEAESTTSSSTATQPQIPASSSAGSKRPATTDVSEQAETQVKRPALRPATGIVGQHQSNATSSPGPISDPQQDTSEGNSANKKGSVSGEAGSRKSQKPRGEIFGSLRWLT